jgi:hypothetical protein
MFEIVLRPLRVQTNWIELATVSYTGSCLMHISHIFDQYGRLCLLTAAGDGCLAIWTTELDLTSDVTKMSDTSVQSELRRGRDSEESIGIKLLKVHRVHQSTVKCCHILPFKALCTRPTYLIVSGGDDNAVALTFVQFPEPQTDGEVQVKVMLIPDAHTGSVVSVQAFWEVDYHHKSHSGTFPIRIVTLGADQRIKLWSIHLQSSINEYEWNIERLFDKYTAVADPGCLDIANSVDGQFKVTGIVVGVGLERWDLGEGHISETCEPIARISRDENVERPD